METAFALLIVLMLIGISLICKALSIHFNENSTNNDTTKQTLNKGNGLDVTLLQKRDTNH